MRQRSDRKVIVEPGEILIEKLEVSSEHRERVRVFNPMAMPIEVVLLFQPSEAVKCEINPPSKRISSESWEEFSFSFSLLQPLSRQTRELIQVKSEYFQEQISVKISPPIDLLEEKVVRLETELELMATDLQAARDNSWESNEEKNKKILKVLENKDSYIGQLEKQNKEQGELIDTLRGNINQLTLETENSQRKLESLHKENSELKQRNSLKEHEELLRDKDRVITELIKKVKDQSEHIDNMLGKCSETSYNDLLAKVLYLEEENKVLTQNTETEDLKQQIEILQSELSEKTKQIPSESLISENKGLLKKIEILEQTNLDLKEDLNNIYAKIDNPDEFASNIAAQTQLVSRLNARISTLKTREEQTIMNAAKIEQELEEIKKQYSQDKATWVAERNSMIKRKKTGTKGSQTETAELEEEWKRFENRRNEIKLAENNKEIMLYQMKYYDLIKDNQDNKERFAYLTSQQIEENNKIRKEILFLEEKLCKSQDALLEYTNSHQILKDELEESQKTIEENKINTENKEKTYKTEIEALKDEVAQLKNTISQKENSIQDRTAQIAVLMESMESSDHFDVRLSDLTAQLCHSKAIEESLRQEISELNFQLSSVNVGVLEKSKKISEQQEKIDALQLKNSSLTQKIGSLTKRNDECSSKISSLNLEVTNLRNSLKRKAEDEDSMTNKLHYYIQQLNQSHKRNAEILSKERQESMMASIEYTPKNFESPLLLAINQLSIALNSVSKRVKDPHTFAKIVSQLQNLVLECDSVMRKSESKIQELEFTLQSEVVYKYAHKDTLEHLERMEDLMGLFFAENNALKAISFAKKEDIYSSRITTLENSLGEKNNTIEALESDNRELKKALEMSSHRVKVLQDQCLAAEANNSIPILTARLEKEIRNKLQNEEIKSFDLGQDLKTQLKDLKFAVKSLTAERNALEIANAGLSAIIKESEQRELNVSIHLTTQSSRAIDQKNTEIFKLKEKIESQNEEIFYLSKKINDSNREIQSLLGFKATESEEKSKSQVSELKENHRLELENIKTATLLELQSYKDKLDADHASKCEMFKDGEFPGDYRLKNQQLNLELDSFIQENEKLKDENIHLLSTIDQLNMEREGLFGENSSLKQVISGIGEIDTTKKTQSKSFSHSTEPQVLIRALIAAKIGEGEALRKAKAVFSTQEASREQLVKAEETVRALELKLKSMRRYLCIQGVPEPPDEDYIEMNNEYTLKKKIKELETEITILRNEQSQAWGQFLPFSSFWKHIPEKEEDWTFLIESILYLTEEIAESDRKEKNLAVEKSQRIVIRSLLKGLESINYYKPTHEEDRKIWYLELLDSLLQNSNEAISNLISFTNQLTVELTGSMSSTAQYKGAAIELAKVTKEASEDINALRHSVLLIKSDIEYLQGGEVSAEGFKERAFLAESLKQKMEEELLKTKVECSYQVSEMQQTLENFQSEAKAAIENYDGLLESYNKIREEQVLNNKHCNKLELIIKEKDDRNEALRKEIQSVTALHTSAGKQINSLQEEIRQHKQSNKQTLQQKDKLIEELQLQVKSTYEEKMGSTQEANALRRTVKQLKSNLEIEKNKGEYNEENQALKREVVALKEDAEYKTDKFKKERDALNKQIKELEIQVSKLSHGLKRERNRRKKERSNSVDRGKELEEHTKAIDFISQKTVYESNIRNLTEQYSHLQKQYKEKISLLEEESQIRIQCQNKIEQLLEQDEIKSKEIEKINTEHKQMSEDYKKFESSNKELTKRNSELNAEAKRFKVANKDLQRKLALLETDNKRVSANFSDELSTLHKKIEENNTNQHERTQELESKICSLAKEKNDLQKEYQETQAQLEKTNSLMNQTQKESKKLLGVVKDLEGQLLQMTNEKENLEGQLNEKIVSLKEDLSYTYFEFEKTIEKYETQLTSMKEMYSKTPKIDDYIFQISKKDALIKSLKNELKTKKRPKTEQATVEDVRLENQLFQQRALYRQLELKLKETNSELEKARSEESKSVPPKREIGDLERRHKIELNRLQEDIQRLKERWHSPEDWNSLLNTNSELELALKRAQEDIARKKEIIDNYRNTQHTPETPSFEVESLNEKLKKMRQEIARKDKTILDLRAESHRELEVKVPEDTGALNERIKSLRAETNRKDSLIKDLKQKIEKMNEQEHNKNGSIDRMQEQIKRMKAESERKEMLAKNTRNKLDNTLSELDTYRSDTQALLDKERKKNEKAKIKLGKTRKQLDALYSITKVIFRDLNESVNSLKKRVGSSRQENYTDCLDILNMNIDELTGFIGDNSIQDIERMIDSKQIEPSRLIQVFKKLLDERVELEKSGGDVARKYEEYIHKMKHDIHKQKKHYESKISNLERRFTPR